jgi:hypothetical protein
MRSEWNYLKVRYGPIKHGGVWAKGGLGRIDCLANRHPALAAFTRAARSATLFDLAQYGSQGFAYPKVSVLGASSWMQRTFEKRRRCVCDWRNDCHQRILAGFSCWNWPKISIAVRENSKGLDRIPANMILLSRSDLIGQFGPIADLLSNSPHARLVFTFEHFRPVVALVFFG